MDIKELTRKFHSAGLKVTPQRIAVYTALKSLTGHPTTDTICKYVRKHHPSTATGTVYKILETFTANNLIRKIMTENDITRYDSVTENHHHIYCTESESIQDYFDQELDELLGNYFKNRVIEGFEITEIKTQIKGKFHAG
jgi:Fur family transcriptional regulator, peroxide stress response regulator